MTNQHHHHHHNHNYQNHQRQHLQYFNPNRLDYDNPNHYYYFYNNGIIPSLTYTFSSATSSPASLLPYFNPDSFCIPPSTWSVAEDVARVILNRVQPTLDADQKRKDVTDYLQTLIGSAIHAEIVPYGSVPLKTYLPDGDIDLTVLSATKSIDALVSDIRAILEKQQKDKAGHYEIRNVQFIDAEVKIVKCLIQNIVVDISFNQLGGICTLCFLEQVDRLIGRDHLFKRSIILIKAWCYYESRILGAHHGLISTYALETLVLYVFNMFHSSIDGPVAVLYRFLDYFSKFDWDNYCISLNGPVPRAALPDVLADIPDDGWNDVLLSPEFLNKCIDMFSVPSKDPETNTRVFAVKRLNIIDPLKVNNNLGRSVHRGNFYRIRSALRYGARELGWILSLPGDRLSDELKRFFSNSLETHGNKYWDMPIPLFPLGVEDPGTSPFTTSSSSEGNSIVGYGENEVSLVGDEAFTSKENLYCCLTEVADCHAYGGLDDEFNKTFSEFVTTGGTYFMSDCSITTCDTDSLSLCPDHCYSRKETDMVDNEHQYQERDVKNAVMKKGWSTFPKEDVLAFINSNLEDGFAGDSDESNPVLDLTGDYECHIRSLLYGLNCQGYALSPTPATFPCKPFSRLRNRYPYESMNHSSQFKQSARCQRRASGFTSPRPPIKSSQYGTSSYFGVRSADKQKIRGTGTYLPNINHPSAREALQPDSPNSGTSTLDIMTPDENDYWLSKAHFPALCEVKSGLHPSSESSAGIPFSLSPDKLEFGSFKRWQSLGPSTERGVHKASNSVSASNRESSLGVLEGAADGSCESVSDAKLTCVAERALELEDTAEFPPLSM